MRCWPLAPTHGNLLSCLLLILKHLRHTPSKDRLEAWGDDTLVGQMDLATLALFRHKHRYSLRHCLDNCLCIFIARRELPTVLGVRFLPRWLVVARQLLVGSLWPLPHRLLLLIRTRFWFGAWLVREGQIHVLLGHHWPSQPTVFLITCIVNEVDALGASSVLHCRHMRGCIAHYYLSWGSSYAPYCCVGATVSHGVALLNSTTLWHGHVFVKTIWLLCRGTLLVSRIYNRLDVSELLESLFYTIFVIQTTTNFAKRKVSWCEHRFENWT